MIDILRFTPCRLRPAMPVLAIIALLGCDQRGPPSDTAVSNPSKFAEARQRTASQRPSGEEADRDPSAPGVGMRHGSVRGARAGRRGLHMVLQSVVTEDGELIIDRLSSSMNMDLLELAISSFSDTDLPEAPRDQLVFYCNAYNANALAILTMFALDSDCDFVDTLNDDGWLQRNQHAEGAGSLAPADEARLRFDEQPVMVAGVGMTMAELRDTHILGFGDPRVLAYLIEVEFGSVRLPRESLLSRRLDTQLDAMCETWINTGMLARFEDDELRLSPVLTRHARAFDVEPFRGVIGFLEHYAEAGGPVAAALAQSTSQPETVAR